MNIKQFTLAICLAMCFTICLPATTELGPTIPPSPWDDNAPTLTVTLAQIPAVPLGVGPTIPPCQWDQKWCDDCWEDITKCHGLRRYL